MFTAVGGPHLRPASAFPVEHVGSQGPPRRAAGPVAVHALHPQVGLGKVARPRGHRLGDLVVGHVTRKKQIRKKKLSEK
ncbi:hypothetical protein IscW_ISCW024161 [Ixodes scapularis]|uniref:Uncharacterized protein n=1 Tax=Ixodes scapularis TaxID=6945 RepID=B7PCB7_IXOSC|nr:hypothetical protein IscW_ISCW024161 [Ixodes scapularis]|eukprot:XP_002409626.1 hypothetical protein IscW_ISCW024161 [Ixodes scapularis]